MGIVEVSSAVFSPNLLNIILDLQGALNHKHIIRLSFIFSHNEVEINLALHEKSMELTHQLRELQCYYRAKSPKSF